MHRRSICYNNVIFLRGPVTPSFSSGHPLTMFLAPDYGPTTAHIPNEVLNPSSPLHPDLFSTDVLALIRATVEFGHHPPFLHPACNATAMCETEAAIHRLAMRAYVAESALAASSRQEPQSVSLILSKLDDLKGLMEVGISMGTHKPR